MDGCLSGMKILDVTSWIAGPYCTKLLADYGADVIKVEKAGDGDGMRRYRPFLNDNPDPEGSILFHYLNTNKKGIVLNLKSASGQKIFRQLAANVDVVVESFKPGIMSSWGLGYEDLEKVNPRLVMTSLSNFGQTGPYRDYKATHITLWALGGWAHISGERGGRPMQAGGLTCHYTGGLLGALGTIAAYDHSQRTGQGQHVDISMMEAIFLSTAWTSSSVYSYLGQTMYRVGNEWPFVIVRCRDGYLGLNVLTDTEWELFCVFIGKPELIDDPRFANGLTRRDHGDELVNLVSPWFVDLNKEEVFELAQEMRVPVGVVNTAADVLQSSQHKAREFFVDVDIPGVGPVPQPGGPFKIGEGGWQCRHRAPRLGEHNVDIYHDVLGYSTEDLVRLQQMDVI